MSLTTRTKSNYYCKWKYFPSKTCPNNNLDTCRLRFLQLYTERNRCCWKNIKVPLPNSRTLSVSSLVSDPMQLLASQFRRRFCAMTLSNRNTRLKQSSGNRIRKLKPALVSARATKPRTTSDKDVSSANSTATVQMWLQRQVRMIFASTPCESFVLRMKNRNNSRRQVINDALLPLKKHRGTIFCKRTNKWICLFDAWKKKNMFSQMEKLTFTRYTNGSITPLIRFVTSVTLLFSAICRGYNSIYNW